MKIYRAEIIDGLEDKLKCNAIAYNCSLERIDKPTRDIDFKSIASFGADKNFDLYFLKSILASVGINKNDDVFLAQEIWAAKDTPIYKQFNYMHNEKDIIGAIISSFLLSSDGSLISSEDQMSNIKDIGTESVIWTQWADKKLADRLHKIIAQIEKGELFVSMECLFNKFDYLHIKGNNEVIIPRTEQTAFLTKHLRGFGGVGEFDGGKLYRVLRDFTFSGKGLVDDPANPRSIIDDSLGENNTIPVEIEIASLDKVVSEVNKSIKAEIKTQMEEELKREIAELKDQLAKAQESIASMSSKAEIETLKSQNAALQALAEETKAKMNEMEEECAKKVKAAEDAVAGKLQEAEAKIAELVAEKVVANRKTQLAVANVDSSKVEEIMSTWANCSDEQFTKVVALYANKSQITEVESTNTTVEDVIEKARASLTNVNLNIEKEDRILTVSKSIASKLKFLNPKKSE